MKRRARLVALHKYPIIISGFWFSFCGSQAAAELVAFPPPTTDDTLWYEKVEIPSTFRGSVQPSTLFSNITFRVIADSKADVESYARVMKKVIGALWDENGITYTMNIWRSVAVPVVSYDTAKSSGSQPSVSPLADSTSTLWDAQMLGYGNSSSHILQIIDSSPIQMSIMAGMLESKLSGSVLAINLSLSSTIQPLAWQVLLAPVYVLASVLEIHWEREVVPITDIKSQNWVLSEITGVIGSQTNFLFNRLQSIYSDHNKNLTRVAVFSYSARNYSTISELANTLLPEWMLQVTNPYYGNFAHIDVLFSQPLGTQAEEIMGDPRFTLPLATEYTSLMSVTQPVVSGSKVSAANPASVHISVTAKAGIAGSLTLLLLVAVGSVLIQVSNGGLVKRSWLLKSAPSPAAAQMLTHHEGGTLSQSTLSHATLQEFVLVPDMRLERNLPAQLSEAWSIDPAKLAICQHQNGEDWILGEGTSNIVYRGLRGGVQDVAIKIMHQSVPECVFEKELALLRHLNFDKNIVQFYGACVSDESMMVIMEYMPGGDLAAALARDGKYELGWYGRGSSILLDVARGLHFLHSNDAAHRNLKSRNIMLTLTGTAKIGDVGLAKLMSANVLSTQNASGALAHAAPEILMGEVCDKKVDIYSFAIICWEVCTHEAPEGRESMYPLSVPEQAPQEVAVLIDACLQQSPRLRPSAKDVFETLLELCHDRC